MQGNIVTKALKYLSEQDTVVLATFGACFKLERWHCKLQPVHEISLVKYIVGCGNTNCYNCLFMLLTAGIGLNQYSSICRQLWQNSVFKTTFF